MTAAHLKPNKICREALRILRRLNRWAGGLIVVETPIFLLIMFSSLQPQYKMIEVAGYASLLFLAYLDQKRTTIPFPFLAGISVSDCIAYASLAFVSTWFLSRPSLPRWVIVRDPLSAINAGITEESLKVALTNILAYFLFKRTSRVGTRRMVVWVSGIISVVIWGLLHVLTRGYAIEFVFATIFTGVVYFAIVYHKRNYVPVVFGHIFYDMMLPSPFFS